MYGRCVIILSWLSLKSQINFSPDVFSIGYIHHAQTKVVGRERDLTNAMLGCVIVYQVY